MFLFFQIIAVETVGKIDGAANTFYLVLNARAALFRRISRANFVGIQLIFYARVALRGVGHYHVGPALQCEQAALRVERFHGGSGGDIDVRQ